MTHIQNGETETPPRKRNYQRTIDCMADHIRRNKRDIASRVHLVKLLNRLSERGIQHTPVEVSKL